MSWLALLLAFTTAGLDLPVEKPQPVQQGPRMPPVRPERKDDPRPHDYPPPTLFGEEIPKAHGLVFVLDVSGSMGWDTRLERAIKETTSAIGGLSPATRFGVVRYNCGVYSWRPKLERATPENKASATEWVAGSRHGGGTGTGPAVAFGLSLGPDVLVLLTDGGPNCGAYGFDGHRDMIRRANRRRTPINVFGFAANGTYRGFCQGVATDSGGTFTDVP